METATYRDGFTSGGHSAKVTLRPVGRAHTSSTEDTMAAAKAKSRGRLIYDDYSAGMVCTCTEHVYYGECEGHPAGAFDPMGQTVYCDGTCNPVHADYQPTVTADPASATETGSYWYTCSRCGAGAWSGL